MSRLLIVEDEQHLADGLRFNLEAEVSETTCDYGREKPREQLASPSRCSSMSSRTRPRRGHAATKVCLLFSVLRLPKRSYRAQSASI